MADSDEKSGPQTLASLWLKSKPTRSSRPTPEPESLSAESPSSESPSSESQMGLLFSSPASSPSQPPPPTTAPPDSAPPPTTPRRRPVLTPKPAVLPVPAERRIWTVRDLVTGIRQQVERE